ncbi:hypothetical protein [uncultured Amnibacterium sp.]|uniref:hypothetical protein n=1 Tax=uncultured Amnibacterium sp. TaxID=1631851 RepID=UPI0035CBAC64
MSSRLVRGAAVAAIGGVLALAGFQVALAAGAPLGRAAWGGTHPGVLPVELRAASGVSAGVWILGASVVAARAGFGPGGGVLGRGIWAVIVVLLLGALANLASSSPWERGLWFPVACVLALLCGLVARGNRHPRP